MASSAGACWGTVLSSVKAWACLLAKYQTIAGAVILILNRGNSLLADVLYLIERLESVLEYFLILFRNRVISRL